MTVSILKSAFSTCALALTLMGCTDDPQEAPTAEEALVAAASAVYTESCEGSDRVCSESHAIEVLGSLMHYRQAGDPNGNPIILLHGQPTWSYLWRNVIPNLPVEANIIAPDAIGYGFSESPNIDYTWLDQVNYIEAFIEAMDLHDVTIVVHDMGSFQGLAYAQRHPENVRGLVMMESVLAPFPAPEDFPPLPPGPATDRLMGFLNFVGTVKSDPAAAVQMVVDNNIFIESFLPDLVVSGLSEAAHNAYRLPFLEPESRVKMIQVPKGMPLGGMPVENHDFVSQYAGYLGTSDVPKLLLYGEPGFLFNQMQAEGMAAQMPNTEAASIGEALHFVQEDQPDAIASAITAFYRDRVWAVQQ